MTETPRDILKALLDAALAAADPYEATLAALRPPARGRNVVIGAGKAAARMAQAVEDRYGNETEGFVIVPKGYGAPLKHIRIIEAAHPVPDDAGEAAACAALSLAGELGEGDRLIALISGGGSALMAAPAAGITLADKQRITGELLRSGAPITAINTVRKHLSAIKGGWLAKTAFPARAETLVVSDIPGDDAAMVASGPTLRDDTGGADALSVLEKYGIDPGDAVRKHLENPASNTPDADDACFAEERVVIVTRAADALAAAAAQAAALGLRVIILGDHIEGEARNVAAEHARLALEEAGKDEEGPVAILSGGETSVTVGGMGDGRGRGGRNTEFALALALALAPDGGEALALALDGAAGIYAMAVDTDGVDGTSLAAGGGSAAGAVVTPTTLARARDTRLDPAHMLAGHDSARFFDAIGDLVITGPTLTNVNDFRALIVGIKT